MDTRSPQETDRLVGRRIREGRFLKGMSQEKLAKALGLSFQQIQKYENGKNRISVGRLSQISHIFEVPEQWFFGESGFPFPPEMEPEMQKLLLMCKDLNRQGLEALMSVAHIMKKATPSA